MADNAINRSRGSRATLKMENQLPRLSATRTMEILFPNRIARMSYFVRHILIILATIPLVDAMDAIENKDPALVDLWLLLAAFALAGYWVLFIVRPRCKDMGINAWYSLLALIPLVDLLFGLMLLLARSKPNTDNS